MFFKSYKNNYSFYLDIQDLADIHYAVCATPVYVAGATTQQQWSFCVGKAQLQYSPSTL